MISVSDLEYKGHKSHGPDTVALTPWDHLGVFTLTDAWLLPHSGTWASGFL